MLVIHHGMAEHRERYMEFISFLCAAGVAVYIHDMANHGKSNRNTEETGWFGETDGWKKLIEDYRTVFMGTGGANKAAGAGILAAKMIGTIKGKKHKSNLLNKMAFGTYNKRFEEYINSSESGPFIVHQLSSPASSKI